MSKHDFSFSEFASRRCRVRNAIREAGLDWLVVTHPVSLHWLTGSDAKSYQEFQCLFVSAAEGPATVLTREGERAEFEQDALVDEVVSYGGREDEDPLPVFERTANRLGLSRGRVGLEVPAYYLHPRHYAGIGKALGSSLVAEPENLIADLKLVKSPAELVYIREAARIADLGLAAFLAALRPGCTELEVAAEVYREILQAGSGLAASPMNLVSGERAGFSHGAPTQRKLVRGDSGSIEFGTAYRRYTSTIGRNFSIGPPSPRVRELHRVVCEAADACRAEIRPGVPATAPHAAAKKVIGSAGLERGRVHTTGYGLAPGFPPTWGEPLHMLAGSRYTLQAGMVLTIEPPVFLGDERLGARVIDNVLVTETGAELLSRFSRDLICVE